MRIKKCIPTIVILALTLTGCNFKNNKNIPSETENQISTKKIAQNKQLENKIPYIKLSNVYSADTMNFSIINSEWTNEIKPNTTQEFYTYYKTNDPSTETLLKINASFKNLNSESIDLNSFSYQIVINDKYVYLLTPTYEENGTFASLVSIKPLEEKNIILFATIPIEAKNILQKSILEFGYNTNEDNNMFYSYDSREHKIEFEIGNIKDNTLNPNSSPSSNLYTPSTNQINNNSFDIGTTHKTLVDDVNVRAGAGFSYEKLYKIPINTEITILDKQTADNRVWCKIGENEWISLRTINGEL